MPRNLAEIAVEEGLVDDTQAAAAERRARRAAEPVVVALAELVPEASLAVVLARHLRAPIVQLASESLDPEALREVPHELAQRRRLLPLELDLPADGSRTLRVAMADPTDRDGIAEVEITSGCEVDPVLATLGAVEEAIDRAYRGNVTAVMRVDIPDDEDDPGACARVPFGGGLAATGVFDRAGLGTEPFHRVDDEAPLELRHRALLGLLLDRGILTEEDYLAEVRRLLRERG